LFLLLHMLLIPKERKGMRWELFYTAHSELKAASKKTRKCL
jgi:hypothetical protein